MIACISPEPADYGESLSTLVYASAARNVRNRPVVVSVVESFDWGRKGGLPAAEHNENESKEKLERRLQLEKIEEGRIEAYRKEICDLRYVVCEAKYLLGNVIKKVPSDDGLEGVIKDLKYIDQVLVGENDKCGDVKVLTRSIVRTKDEEIHVLKDKLTECEKDLERDEEIFAVKSKDVRKLEKCVKTQSGRIKELELLLESKEREKVVTPPADVIMQDVGVRLQNETSAFHAKQRQYDREIQSLAINIQVKQDLIETIDRSSKDATSLMLRHEERKRDLSGKISRLRQEIDRKEQDRLELSVASTVSNDSLYGGGGDDQHERSLEDAEGELISLSHQIRDQQRIVALQKQSVARISELRQEIEGMLKQKKELSAASEKLEADYVEARKAILAGVVLPQPQGGEVSPLKDGSNGADDKENGGAGGPQSNSSLKKQLELEKKRSEELLGINMKLLQDLKFLSAKEKERELERVGSAGSEGRRRVVVNKKRLVEVPPPPPGAFV